ncbi:MAG: DNA-binding protein [Candidatus Micrarchaeota archaeon]|nr:DNA-binding protein [Candidatus Micrarchaeota archaeon]
MTFEGQSDENTQLDQMRRLRNQEANIRSALNAVLDPKALERLSLIRMSNERLYSQIVSYLFSLVNSGKIKGKVNEEQVKQIASLFLSQKKEGSITRLSK